MSHDPGDEDDFDTHPRRFWPTFRTGPTVVYWPRSWSSELVSAPSEHDPGDEEPRWEPLSDVSRMRLYKRLL